MKSYTVFSRIVIFFLGIGLLILAFEVYLQHYKQLEEKNIMWIPIIFGLFGGLATILVAIVFNKYNYYLFIVVMLISIFVGMYGLYLHNKWRYPSFVKSLLYKEPFDFEILTTYTPLLAPSAFIALGGLGILIAFFKSRED